jgi:ankyrin repeat protein
VSGRLPVHVALENQVSGELLPDLVGPRPQALREVDVQGNTPLHVAVRGRVSLEVLRYLIQTGIQELGFHAVRVFAVNFLPLHVALTNCAPMEEVEALVEPLPEFLEIARKGTGLSLRIALSNIRHYGREEGRELVRYLARMHLPALLEAYALGELPLHYALRSDVPVWVVQELVELCPEALQRVDGAGNSPLDTALRFGAASDVVRCIVAARPEEALLEINTRGELPICAALAARSSIDVVRLLAETRPDALQVRQPDGLLPLHFALRLGVEGGPGLDPAYVRLLVEHWPGALLELDTRGWVPLQIALNRIASMSYAAHHSFYAAHYLLQQGERAMLRSDRVPLASTADCEVVVMFLIERWRRGLRAEGANGYLPLPATLRGHADTPVARYMVRQRPTALHERDDDGSLPVHVALRVGATVDVVQCLVEPWDQCLQETDGVGRLALHVAAESAAAIDVVELLTQNHPDAVNIRDSRGFLPIHAAAAASSTSDRALPILQHLFHLWPESLNERDRNGRLPFHVAALNPAAELDVLLFLLKAWPPAVSAAPPPV